MAPDRYRYFRIEAREITDQIGQVALDLEKASPAPGLIAQLLRLAHTLKGAALVVKQRGIAERTHLLEDALAPFRDAAIPVPRERIDEVLSFVDEIDRQLAQLPRQASDAESSGSAQTDQALLGFRPEARDLDAVHHGVAGAYRGIQALRPRLAQLGRASHLSTLVLDQLRRPRDPAVLRADGQLPGKVLAMAEDLSRMCGGLEHDLATTIDQLDRELRQVREAAERLRLAPASALFTFLERTARDAARTLGKRVIFDAAGGDLRVDSLVLAVIQGALLHVVRNAVAHGIEAGDDQRRTAGKPLAGRVSLRVSRRGTEVSFTCSDDGRGIDLEAVRRIARRKGLDLEEERTLDTEGLLRLLLKGGISTSPTVDEISGRGVGLAVVWEAAQRLGGTVTARTAPGSGTTVEITVPLSIASFAALFVAVGDQTMAIPLDAVVRTVRVAPADIAQTDRHESVLFEGQPIPLVWLRQTVTQVAPPPWSSEPVSAIVLRGLTGVAAFVTDRILATGEVVMHPLPPLAPATSVIAGAAFDDDGDPRLVLDSDGLVSAAQRGGLRTQQSTVPRPTVLVVDDSVTTRMLEQSILESAGYAVDLAASAEEALEKAHLNRYALILVDVEMPGMDGFTFVERMRADPALREIPAILVTSRNSPAERQRGSEVGGQAYIVKGEFDQDVLLDRVRTLVG